MKRLFYKGLNSNLLFWLVIAANVIGAVYGFVFYYWDRIISTPFPLVLFVPDCPLYVSLFVVSALIMRYRIKSWASDIFVFIASAGLMKYTLWTMFVILFFNSYFLSPEVIVIYAVLFVAHFLAFLEVFTFIGRLDAKIIFIAAAVIWLVANDFVDYALGTHPTLPAMDIQTFTILIGFTVMLSLLCPVMNYFALKSKFKSLARLLFG